jgi:hypothetical protein
MAGIGSGRIDLRAHVYQVECRARFNQTGCSISHQADGSGALGITIQSAM